MPDLAFMRDPKRAYLIEIRSPWDAKDYLTIDYPEHFLSDQGSIMVYDTPTRGLKFTDPFRWQISGDGREAGYDCRFENGLRFSVLLKHKGCEVTQEVRICNGSTESLKKMQLILCLSLDSWREFENTDDKMAHLDRTYTIVDGEIVSMRQLWETITEEQKQRGKQIGDERVGCVGCNVKGQRRKNNDWNIAPRQCDAGFIAVRSKQRSRCIAISWPKCRKVFTSINTPCIHADPELSDCPPGEEVSAAGRIIFHDGDLPSLIDSLQIGPKCS